MKHFTSGLIYRVTIIIVLLTGSLSMRADEGMWLPYLLNRLTYTDMQAQGLQLTQEELFSMNNSSLKDAIILFGRGCTGEIVSDQGLIFTNHHCGYGSIQQVSSVGSDFLTDGFWARSFKEEIPIHGLTVQFLDHLEVVTDEVLKGIKPGMTDEIRHNTIEENKQRIVNRAIEKTTFNAVVKEFYSGNEFILFVYQTYRDVRLVGTPPSSVGKFGADTDNWMWPRHTGDFSIFRVYVDKNGRPASYHPDNIPMKPKHYLPINAGGVKKGDFAMIMGYPGSTDRYLTSWGVNLAINQTNPTIVDIRRQKLDIWGQDMAASDEVRIKYASKYAGVANYWKYFIGQTKGLKRLKVAEKKVELENKFGIWSKSDTSLFSKYGNVRQLFHDGYDELEKVNIIGIYTREAIRGTEILSLAARARNLLDNLNGTVKPEINMPDPQKDLLKEFKQTAEDHFKNYNRPTDEKIMAAMLHAYYNGVPAVQHPEWLTNAVKKYKGDFKKMAADIFAKSMFASQEKIVEFLRKPSAKAIAKDPAFICVMAFYNQQNVYKDQIISANEKIAKARRLFMAGLREMDKNKIFYPDANQTMRLTYGTVQDYFPADAIHYEYFTTHKGILEKEDPTNYEFVVPAKLKELLLKKDFGPWGEGDVLKTCFLTNHDITGGNSGSPVLNGKGELLGLAFDGNWEAMSGDIAFEPELQRTINVDIRYVLFIIDKYAGAQRIIDELKIVR